MAGELSPGDDRVGPGHPPDRASRPGSSDADGLSPEGPTQDAVDRDHRPDADGDPADGDGGGRKKGSFWKELPVLLLTALLLTFLIQTFLARVYVIPSASMERTLHGCPGCTNDRVLVDKLTYVFTDPGPGDVVVFRGPPGWAPEFQGARSANMVVRWVEDFGSALGIGAPNERDFVKRIIAVGGQTVECCDEQGRILVDGKPLDEPYIHWAPGRAPQMAAFGKVTVPPGHLWMMGDNRNNSSDSRAPGHGPVPVSDVIGKARLIVLPINRIGGIDDHNPQNIALGAPGWHSGLPAAVGLAAAFPVFRLGTRVRSRMTRRSGR